MFTLRIIFVGLVAILAHPEDPGQRTAVLIDQADHVPIAILLEGACSGEMCHHGDDAALVRVRGGDGNGFEPGLVWDLRGMDLRLQRLVEDAVVDAGGRGMTRAGWAEFPHSPDEGADVTWVPDLPTILGGTTPPPRPSCFLTPGGFGRGDDWDCPVSARFGFTAGRLANCHVAHEPVAAGEASPETAACGAFVADPAARVAAPLFDIGPHYRQAMGDTTVLELRIHESGVELEGFAWRERKLLTGVLRPREDEDLVTLVLLNEPFVAPATHGGIVEPVEVTHEHFAGFYGLYDSAQGELREQPVPQPVPGRHAMVHPGLCEPYLRCIDELFFVRPRAEVERLSALGTADAAAAASVIEASVPHGASECDNSTSGP